MFRVLEITKDDLVAIQVQGEVDKEDYDKINPLIDKAVEAFGEINLLIYLDRLKAVTPDALIKDVKTYINHFNHFRKIAVVGDSNWKELIAKVAGPFISGRVKYFPESEFTKAHQWLIE